MEHTHKKNFDLKAIRQAIADDLKTFEKSFNDHLRSDVFLLDQITRYLLRRKGKQIRPTMVLLMAHIYAPPTERTYLGATLIELLHTATLVHDDVVDDAHYRRGLFSVNALWKNKIAVLIGDYMLSRGLMLCVDTNELRMLKIVSQAVREMSEGELLQIEKARKLDITEDVYFEIIRKNTAVLLASCLAAGAESTQNDPANVDKAWKLGETIGMAFQIKDDIFDYGVEDVGKPLGIDIKEKKMTLPLIYALNHTTPKQKKHIINTIKRHSQKAHKVREVLQFVQQSGGLEYSRKTMENFYNQAQQQLADFPESIWRDRLSSLIDFVIMRKK